MRFLAGGSVGTVHHHNQTHADHVAEVGGTVAGMVVGALVDIAIAAVIIDRALGDNFYACPAQTSNCHDGSRVKRGDRA